MSNFKDKYKDYFPNKIRFCKEVIKSIEKFEIGTQLFNQSMDILIDIERGVKNITDFDHSTESKSVENDPDLRKLRVFTINDDTKAFFSDHMKVTKGDRMYYKTVDGYIYIGYIGVHLRTKKF